MTNHSANTANKVVSLEQFSNLFKAKLTAEIDFSQAIQINMQASEMMANLQTIGQVHTERQKQLCDAFLACNDDNTHGFYKDTVTNNMFISGASIQAFASILVGNSDNANANAQAVVNAVSNAYEQAEDHKPFVSYGDTHIVDTQQGQVHATIRPLKIA